MLRCFVGAAVLALAITPATAQTTSGQTDNKAAAPAVQNSGAGVKGSRGSKSGLPPLAPGNRGGTTGEGASISQPQSGDADATIDAAKVLGKRGGKAGPAVAPPSHSNSNTK